MTPDERLALDPYLGPVSARWGRAAAEEAGWWDDGDPVPAPLDDTDWLCTPTAHVRHGLSEPPPPGSSGPPVVLLATGGFFPVHDGHLAMMAAARGQAEAAGWWVVGGYLSPGHDDYIAHKCGADRSPVAASERLASVAAATAATPWLGVDPWEAQARRLAVTFTDVTARLQAYLRHHLDRRLEVAYVCGADNARFALAFAERGRAIVVGRPGSEAEAARWRHDERLAADGRLLWSVGDDHSCSSALRPVPTRPPTARLSLRVEDARVVEGLGLSAASWSAFQGALRDLLASHVPVVAAGVPAPARPERGDQRVLSLDPMVVGTHALGISRCFDLGGHRFVGHVGRPGSPPAPTQLATLPAGRYAVWDDDRATGGTLAFLRASAPPGVELTAVEVGVDGRRLDQPADIADSRDFLLGTVHGGLVVALPDGTLGRAPYVLPYVDPHARCGLPAAAVRGFSVAVWRLQAEAFRETATTVADLPDPARRTMHAAGHRATDRLDDVCRRHADVLASFG